MICINTGKQICGNKSIDVHNVNVFEFPAYKAIKIMKDKKQMINYCLN